MKDVQCYELFGGIALKNHVFSFSSGPFQPDATVATGWLQTICSIDFFIMIIMRDFFVIFLRKAHSTEQPSRGCPHLVLILQLIRLKQCG